MSSQNERPGRPGLPLPLCLCLLLLMLLCPGAAAARSKGKKAPKASPQVVLAATLNEKRDDIQRCALDYALNRGANRVDIVTHVTINGRGQVVNTEIKVTVEGGDGEQVKTCVEKVVRAIKFPKNDAPLIDIERTWTVAAQ